MQTRSGWLCCSSAGMRSHPSCAGCTPVSWMALDRNEPNRLLKPLSPLKNLLKHAKAIEEPTAEAPAFHTEPVTVYPGEQNHLPYDVVVERLHVDRPEPTSPEPTPARTQSRARSRNTRSPSRSTAIGRPFPTRGRLSRRPTKSTKTTCAATPRISISVTTHLGEGGPRPSTRPMWRRSSC